MNELKDSKIYFRVEASLLAELKTCVDQGLLPQIIYSRDKFRALSNAYDVRGACLNKINTLIDELDCTKLKDLEIDQ